MNLRGIKRQNQTFLRIFYPCFFIRFSEFRNETNGFGPKSMILNLNSQLVEITSRLSSSFRNILSYFGIENIPNLSLNGNVRFVRLFGAALRWSSPWISTNEPRAQDARTHCSRACVSRTLELRWIPTLIFSASRRLFDVLNLSKERIRAILNLRMLVAPTRMP
jgi:hypothetical protein